MKALIFLCVFLCLALHSHCAKAQFQLDSGMHRDHSARINLGKNINTHYSELFPVVSPDENILYFTRKGAPENIGYRTNPNDEDIWYSTREPDGSWSLAKQLGPPLNTTTYDGVRAMNRTATHLYLQNIYRKDGTRGKGFSVSQKNADGSWQFPEPVPIENYYNDTNTAMMTVSTDEDVIILCLERKDTRGKRDLYVTKKLDEHHWSSPVDIAELNTAGDEISPFIAFDDRTLYFSTDGRGGLGSQDVFVTRRLDSTWLHWSVPENLGAPINTLSFDAYFMVTSKGDTAYFSSAHETDERGFGKSDIWKIGLDPKFRPGFYLPDSKPPEEDLTGRLFRLENVFFDVDKSTLRDASVVSLNNLVDMMQQRPKLEIEIQGHTDADASAEHNLILSRNRAASVRQYLIDHGIYARRITSEGFGKAHPIAPNTTPEGKQLNRRVMVLVRKPG